ncbi:MAG TPA: hypothetical protein PK052_05150, partial [Anaerohalosphaeraceae bacterium]|nr:hypothetical protein [Anaerohalosphaeraceae bacterium]
LIFHMFTNISYYIFFSKKGVRQSAPERERKREGRDVIYSMRKEKKSLGFVCFRFWSSIG